MMSIDYDHVRVLLDIEERTRHQPFCVEIKNAVMRELRDINDKIREDNKVAAEEKKRAEAEEAEHQAAVKEAEKPRAVPHPGHDSGPSIYPSGSGVSETETSTRRV